MSTLDYDLAGVNRRRSRQFRRERIDTTRARKLYDKLGSWKGVAFFLQRKSGQAFQPLSIMAAVRWEDKGNAGRLI